MVASKAECRADRLVTGQSPHGSFTDLLDVQQGKFIIREKATEVETKERKAWLGQHPRPTGRLANW